MPTPNLGMDYIANTDTAKLFKTSSIQENNAQKIRDFIGSNPTGVQFYTPVLTAITTNPNLGTGSDKKEIGVYRILPGNLVIGWFLLRASDPNVNAGNNFYNVSLPINADGSFHTFGNSQAGSNDVIGTVILRDNSATSNSCLGNLELISQNQVRLQLESGIASRWMDDINPFTLADGDGMSGAFYYKAV